MVGPLRGCLTRQPNPALKPTPLGDTIAPTGGRGLARTLGANAMLDLDATRPIGARMTHHDKLFFVVANGNAASFAYERLEMHREAVRTQMSRIEVAIQGSRA